MPVLCMQAASLSYGQPQAHGPKLDHGAGMLSVLAHVAAVIEAHFDAHWRSINGCHAFGDSHAGRHVEAIASLPLPNERIISLKATRIISSGARSFVF